MDMTLTQLARKIGATLHGDGTAVISACASIEDAGPGQVAFVANVKYSGFLHSTRAGAVIVSPKTDCPARLNRLVADDPYYAFCRAMIELHGHRAHPVPIGPATRGISSSASIHPGAKLGADCVIHPHAVIEDQAAIGSRCVLYPGAYVGVGASLGDGCILYPNAVVYDRCALGHRVTLHANTVIGHDGFGYATHQGAHHKIPQAGVVVIEDDVELGAGCAVERAAMGETRIGKGTKFADLISIGHGTRIGAHCLFVSLVGVAGSVDVGDYVVLGGQVGVSGHLRIGNHVQVAGKSAVVQDIADGTKVGGVPAVDFDQAKRNALAGMDLYGLAQRVKSLERELARFKSEHALRHPSA
jgi:UDP-3-O-[3-hydroxymyristoyl] glucosamine N-acyltransferase